MLQGESSSGSGSGTSCDPGDLDNAFDDPSNFPSTELDEEFEF